MNARAKKLLEEVLELEPEEREEVAEGLIASLGVDRADVAKEWSVLIQQRADDVLGGRDRGPECRPFLSDLHDRLKRGE